MLNINLHKGIFINILRDIYADPILRVTLGFKGGTAAMLFYELPRFSVDLDFDLLDFEKKEAVFEKIKIILEKYGMLDEAVEKQHTLFFLLKYTKGERNLKVEISKRNLKSEFQIKNYLGVSMLVMRPEDMIAAKLAALLTRKHLATRDVFDLWFFLKNNWQINEIVLKEKTGMSLSEALVKAAKQVQTIKSSELLAGLGELLDNKQKDWVRENLIKEVVFQLRLYKDTHKIPSGVL
ncbi:MAG TPA: nucleotidyl transferase AbiEii/AbiGii toxin family protein [Patescibacteria group bacterium]|nr:nucleotidyl transferase AbiEii/AbiGii toxin family protein [Patescibacteria group bacterium]